MTKVKLHLIRSNDVSATEVENLGLDQALRAACAAGSNNLLELEVVPATTPRDTKDSTAGVLHQILADVLPVTTIRPTREAGLILCRNWKLPSNLPNLVLHGLMFDFAGDDRLGNFVHFGVPRQGCAIFLDTLSGKADDIIFTAIHELGHVFNLQHDSSGQSIMAERLNAPRVFKIQDVAKLATAASGTNSAAEWRHMPGGANFADLTSGPPADMSSGTALLLPGTRRRGKPSTVSLTAKVGKRSYLLGQSVVLELALVVKGDGAVRVPAELDPGHPALRIWFENPSGERLLHRPPVRYCKLSDPGVVVEEGRPYENNPRVTFASDGFNFDAPGRYRIWAEFRLKRGRQPTIVRSSPETFYVRLARDDREAKISSALLNPASASFVARKGGPLTTTERRRLAEIADQFPTHPATQHVRFALAAEQCNKGRTAKAERWLNGLRMSEHSLRHKVAQMRRELKSHWR